MIFLETKTLFFSKNKFIRGRSVCFVHAMNIYRKTQKGIPIMQKIQKFTDKCSSAHPETAHFFFNNGS